MILEPAVYRYAFPAPNSWYHSLVIFFFRLIYGR